MNIRRVYKQFCKLHVVTLVATYHGQQTYIHFRPLDKSGCLIELAQDYHAFKCAVNRAKKDFRDMRNFYGDKPRCLSFTWRIQEKQMFGLREALRTYLPLRVNGYRIEFEGDGGGVGSWHVISPEGVRLRFYDRKEQAIAYAKSR